MGHVLRAPEHRLLLHCVKPILETLCADVPNLYIDCAIRVSEDRKLWRTTVKPCLLNNCCSETQILTRFLLLIAHVDTCFRKLVFALHKGFDDLITMHRFENRRNAGEEKVSEISCRPRGLASNVEAQRSLRVESPIERAAGGEEIERSIS